MKKVKKQRLIIALLLGLMVVILALVGEFVIHRFTRNRSASFRTEGSRLQIFRDNKWREFTVKGVTIGKGTIVGFPGEENTESGTIKKEYARWIKQIAAMNANVIRIETVLCPEFYQAFYEYNLLARRPLYLLQGIWIEESGNESYANAYNDVITAGFFEEITRTIDVIHGKGYAKKGSSSSLHYNMNISPYVMGFILGNAMDMEFVLSTNRTNAKVMGFDGDYLYTTNASPYEAWLAAAGNYAISYEQEKYGGPHRLISWINCPVTDPIARKRDSASKPDKFSGVDFEHICATEKFKSGIFASYSLHPLYTELVSQQNEFSDYLDNHGRPNSYEGYLSRLRIHHSMPVLAAAFGVPSITNRPQSQGAEKAQGEAVANVFDSIINAGLAGGIVYAWHDEAGAGQGNGLVAQDASVGANGMNERLRDSYAVLQEKFAEY